MSNIICKKCGMEIDASLGECPYCGTVYYIIPEEMPQTPSAFSQIPPNSGRMPSHNGIDLERAEKKDIFSAGVWQTPEEDSDSTRIFRQSEPQGVTRQQPQRPQPRRAPLNNVDDDEEEVFSRRKGMNNRTKQMIVAAVALLAILTMVLSFMSGAFDFNKNSAQETMVNVVGLEIERAKGLLEGLGLEVGTMLENSTETLGTVLDQSIKEGKRFKSGDKITLTVSSGQDENNPIQVEEVIVIALLGKTFDQALHELSPTGLILTRAEDMYDDDVEEGKIISQSPAAGSTLQKGDLVTVTVSKGPAPFKITVTAGAGGSVSPAGITEVKKGESAVFTITPDEGYEISDVKVDGKSVGAQSSYTFTDVVGDHSLYVIFREKPNSIGGAIDNAITDFIGSIGN